MSEPLPLILLPGMGADRRLLAKQQAALGKVRVVDWVAARAGETLPAYAERLAEAVDPGGPCLVGGVSMGGMVALEMANHLDARACILISSIRAPRELPRRWRALRPVIRVLPPSWASVPRGIVSAWLAVAGRRLSPTGRSLLEQYAAQESRFIQWALLAVLGWKPSPPRRPIPIVQIHGRRDFILPHRRTRPDVVVAGAGHLLVVTHAETVTAFLREQIEKFSRRDDH
jgi:pimeloyl-ACP methyl ester carboxylesterase